MRFPLIVVTSVALATALLAQGPEPAAGLVGMRQACLDASTDGVILNVAAHPDDESSRTNIMLRRKYGMHVVTVYTTYGDGGQNAIGKEIGPDLAWLRVRETLRAAAMSDVEVRWLGMQDFGFSKTLDETLKAWDGDKLKTAMRKVVDEVDPDLVFTNHDLTHGHGHHRASFWAITEVLEERQQAGKHVPPLYSRCEWTEAQLTFDPGELDPIRGDTYARQAHRAWTNHVTQGPWGPHNALQVGKEHWKVVFPDGVKAEDAANWQHWVRQRASPKNGAEVAAFAALVQETAPSELQRKARALLGTLGPVGATPASDRDLVSGTHITPELDRLFNDERLLPRQALQRILLAAAGVSFETWLERDEVATGGTGKAFVVVHGVTKVKDLQIRCGSATAEPVQTPVRTPPLESATANSGEPKKPPPPPEPKGPEERFQVAFATHGGDGTPPAGPEPAFVTLSVSFTLDGAPMLLQPRLAYTPVAPIDLRWDRDVVMVPKGQVGERIVSATVVKHRDADLNEPVKLAMGPGIKAEAIPGRLALSKEHPEARLLVRATLDGTELDKPGELRLEVAGQSAVLKVVPVEVFVPPGLRIGLVRGPDDTLERALADLGVAYTTLDRDALAVARLEDFGTLLLDMRAYFHRPDLAEHKDRMLQFCRAGGRVVVMYHKPDEWNERPGHPQLAPFPLTVGNHRVTEEDAPVKFLQPEHRLFTHPHKLTEVDFSGWVQERGLHFPTKWDTAWTPLLEIKDSADEKPAQGALLHTQYGRGDFVFCSLVLYRQLRIGHAGAARILVNLLTR